MKRMIPIALVASLHAPVAAQTVECTWSSGPIRLVGTFTESAAMFRVHNDGPSARRVTGDEFAQRHDCPTDRFPDAQCRIEGDDAMGFRFRTVWPDDYIAGIRLPRRDDPDGVPAMYYAARVRVRDIGFVGSPDFGFASIPWGLCSADQEPVPALPLPFIIVGAVLLFLLRSQAR